MSEEIRCKHCGALNEADARFCGDCGGNLAGAGSDTLAAAAAPTAAPATPTATPGGTVLTATPTATPGGTTLVAAPTAAPGGTTLVAAPGLPALRQLLSRRPAALMGGAAALLVVVIAAGFWLAGRKEDGSSSVYLSSGPTTQVGTTTTTGPASPAPSTPAPAGQAPAAPAPSTPAPAAPAPSTPSPSGQAPATPTPAPTAPQPQQPASQPSTPAPQPAPSQPAQAAEESNWKVIARGDMGVNWAGVWPFGYDDATDVFLLTTTGTSVTAHFASWDGEKEAVFYSKSHAGQAIGITAGDMFNMGADQAIVNMGPVIWGFDDALDDAEVANADGMWSNIVIGDFTGSGSSETLAQIPGVGYALYRFYTDRPQQVVGVLRTDKGAFRPGVVDSAGRRLLAQYSPADQKIIHYRWTASGFVAGPSIALTTAPVLNQAFWTFTNGGKQYTVVSLPGGVLKLYRFDGSGFTLTDTINVPGGGNWAVMGGNFTDTGFEIMALDVTNRGRYVIFSHK